MCPDKRVTREIATKRSLKLWPLACIIDEAQNLFGHQKYGKQAGEDAMFIIKIGPPFGVMLDLATQRPDKSLPTGVSSNVGLRFCLKVMDQMANDMVLGTSAYKNGTRATTFRAEVDAGLGYLVGEASSPQVVRTYYLNTDATERVAKRARALREAAGTLSGSRSARTTPRRSATSSPTRARSSPAQRHALAGARRPARRAVPRAVGRGDRRRRAGRARRPRRAQRAVKVRDGASRMPPPRRPHERGFVVIRRYPATAQVSTARRGSAVTRPDVLAVRDR